MKSLTVQLPDSVELQEVRVVLAVSLFERGILSSGQAAELIGVSRKDFLEVLHEFGVSMFGESESDLENVGNIQL